MPGRDDRRVGRVWRSWSSNFLLFVVFSGFAAVATGVALTEEVLPVAAAFGVGAVLFAALAIRSLLLSVTVTERGFRVRELFRTRHVSWVDVDDIRLDGQDSGLAGMLGAVSPIVRLHGHDAVTESAGPDESKLIELRVLGGYPILRFGRPTVAQRAVTGLTWHLTAWRAVNRPDGADGADAVDRP